MIVGLLMFAGGMAAGAFGSLLGLGGGILIVPLLTIAFGLPLREAIGVSLVAVVMTSSAAAAVYLERHVANLRLGMSLELFTAIGALIGGSIAFLIEPRLLQAVFAALLVYVALSMLRGRREPEPDSVAIPDDPASPEPEEPSAVAELSGGGYRVRNLGLGVVGSVGAGLASALLGIGGGIVKVPLMHLGMGVPLRVATATSNLMVGITGAESAFIYLLRDEIDPYVAGPTVIGVFLGATLASRAAHRVDLTVLRWLFVGVLLLTAAQMGIEAIR